MCGIAAIVGKEGQDIVQLRRLLLPIEHRAEAKYFNDSLDLGKCVLGMNRLAIVDREHAKQPIHSSDGRYFIIFNGEEEVVCTDFGGYLFAVHGCRLKKCHLFFRGKMQQVKYLPLILLLQTTVRPLFHYHLLIVNHN